MILIISLEWIVIVLEINNRHLFAQKIHVLPRNPLRSFDQRPRDFRLLSENIRKELWRTTLNTTTMREKEKEMMFLLRQCKVDLLRNCKTRLPDKSVRVLDHDSQFISCSGQDRKHCVGVIFFS